jgi:hypothetical protein
MLESLLNSSDCMHLPCRSMTCQAAASGMSMPQVVPVLSITDCIHLLRRAMVCQAAASGMSMPQAVPDGDVDVPILSSAANTLEWLLDYESFYQKRCAPLAGPATIDVSLGALASPAPLGLFWRALAGSASITVPLALPL